LNTPKNKKKKLLIKNIRIKNLVIKNLRIKPIFQELIID